MKLTKQSASTIHRVLVSGLSGTGKSTLMAELAEQFPLIWIDLENGRDVLTKLSERALANIEYIPIPDSAAYPIAAQTLMQLFKHNKANICEAHGKHECALCKKEGAPIVTIDFSTMQPGTIVAVDSITQLAASILAYACKDKPVDYKPERDDWGALRKYSEFFASQFQAFPYNLVCSCHAVDAEMEDGKTKLVPSFGSKDMSTKIAKAFSDVVYCDIRNKKHVATSSSTAANNVLTKSRSDFLIEALAKPSLIPLFTVPEGVKKDEVQAEDKSQVASQEKQDVALANDKAPSQEIASNVQESVPAVRATSNLAAILAARKAAQGNTAGK